MRLCSWSMCLLWAGLYGGWVSCPVRVTGQEPFRSAELEEFRARLQQTASATVALPFPPEGGTVAVSSAGVPVPVPAEPPGNPGIAHLEEQLATLQQQFQEWQTRAAPTKYPNVVVNGVFQADVGWFQQEARNLATVGDVQDGAGFRRTRLSAKGAVAENVNYMVQMDFGFFGRPTFTDVWLEVGHLPWLGNVRVGQWKQPYGLEVVTSFRYQTFLERSLNFQAFEPFRHIGIGTYDHTDDECTTWAASVFRTGNDQFANDLGDNGGFACAGRLTHLWWYAQDGDRLDYLHTGAAYFRGDPSNDRYRYATIPEFFVGAFGTPAGAAVGTSRVPIGSIANGTPPFVDTGTFPVQAFQHFGSEFAWIQGPFSVQSETSLALVDQLGGGTQLFSGHYTQISYFLTGESRPYDRTLGCFERVQPRQDFTASPGGSVCGRGAWEVAGRFSTINLNDTDIAGGRLHDYTLGLNWYLNPYTKFQFNYIRSHLDHPVTDKSHADIFALRAQLDF